MADNLVRLTGELAERDALRWSPGGVPVVEALLRHRSRQPQWPGGIARDVELDATLVAAGPIAERFDRLAPGTRIAVQGFLARRSRNARLLVLNVTGFELHDGDDDVTNI